ncbi:Nucleotidyltransferase domain-containing protein [Candidatus Electrothrix aarhusensis]|uniref:Nucleotidyltransferase domain-containing protein n=1 Tax=Candidatus Electrothrix aarhusensis TaxID=1859131 RepID=A0A3S3QTN0_9BACT|nr:Nucleotidyltransferase domain-containing protein [Candidatus Electrothrix aarhusensis]
MSIVVQYGSSARGDLDSLSDYDLLIVGRCPQYVQGNPKYDIAKYSKNRLRNLCKNNSLFLIHLREEGKIIEDNDNWMENFLSNVPDFIPNESSLRLSKKNLSIAVSLQPTKKLMPCWYDMIFVFLRDYLVKLNALSKKYVFSVENLLNFLSIEYKYELAIILKICREIKYRYRNGIKQNIFINPIWAANIIKKALHIESNEYSLDELINKKQF